MTMEDAVKNSEDGAKIIKTGEKIEKILWKVFTGGVVLMILSSFFIHPVLAQGESMMPTIKEGTFFLCNRMVKEYALDDIVFIKIPNGTPFSLRIIKRLVALPGDTVEIKDGILYVNGVQEARDFDVMESAGIVNGPIVLAEDEYFVLGDNRNHSTDSREYGPIKKEQLMGRLSKKGVATGFKIF